MSYRWNFETFHRNSSLSGWSFFLKSRPVQTSDMAIRSSSCKTIIKHFSCSNSIEVAQDWQCRPSKTFTSFSALRLVLSVSVHHRLCKVPLQRISLSVTIISTFIIIIIIIIIIINCKDIGLAANTYANTSSAIVPLPLPAVDSGTVYHLTLHPHKLCLSSVTV